MTNLKQPIFWAYTVLFVYAFFLLKVMLILSPDSVTSILGLLFCVVVIVFYWVLVRHPPIPSSHILLRFSPFAIGLLGLFQTCLGSFSLYRFLNVLPLKFDGIRQMYINVSAIILLPVGILIFVFSVLQLISNRMSKNKHEENT